MFSASAAEMTTSTPVSKEATQTELNAYPGGPGKGKRKKSKRMNKKRKRACQKWGRKSYAG